MAENMDNLFNNFTSNLNKARSLDRGYTVEEAACLLHNKNLGPQFSCVLTSQPSGLLAYSEEMLLQLKSIFICRKAAVIVAGGLSFAVGCTRLDGTPWVIDTHSIPSNLLGNGKGIVLFHGYPDKNGQCTLFFL